MDGLWSGQGASEAMQQASVVRHRLLCVNVSNAGFQNDRDISSYASVDPTTMGPGLAPQGGPHFVMSPETSDGSRSYGFEFGLTLSGIVGVDQAVALAGGFSVTWWELIGNASASDGSFTPVWMSFATQTGVNPNELYNSFEVNATALRCQITNVTQPAGSGGSVIIVFAEL